MVAGGGPDHVEGSINNEWVNVMEESNAVFEGDDADGTSEGSVSDNNHVYPNKGNCLADEDD